MKNMKEENDVQICWSLTKWLWMCIEVLHIIAMSVHVPYRTRNQTNSEENPFIVLEFNLHDVCGLNNFLYII